MLELSEPLNVWLGSRDLRASRQFYADRLGLALWREEPGSSLHFSVGGGVLSIYAAAERELPPSAAYLVLPVDSGIDELCARLAERGVVFDEPLADREIGRCAMFRDPDGHRLWVCRPSAAETQFERWRQSERRRLRRIPVQRRPKPRRHERQAPTRRRTHPVE
jgi:catechol 2,3-dioxygenase-like lactoylglutathione lyase family enzyme